MGSVFRRSYIDKRSGQRKLARRYSIRFKNPQGKWCTETTDTCRRLVAQRLLLEREQQQANPPPAPSRLAADMIGLPELVEAYLADRKLRVRPNTWQLYRERLEYTLADLQLESVAELTRSTVEVYVRRRLDSGSTCRTVNLQVALLKRMLRWAVRQEWMGLARNPLETWEPLKETPRRRPALDQVQIQKLLSVAPVHRRMIWAVMLATGVRRSEALTLEQRDFDADRSVIIVRAELAKSARTRVIPIPAGLTALLTQWLAEDLPHRLQLIANYLREVQRRLHELESAGLGSTTQADNARSLEAKLLACRGHQRLFRNGRGLPYLKSNLLREFRVDLAAAGLPAEKFDLHCLRVTNATHLRGAQVSEVALKQRLGHVSLQTTDRHYVDFNLVDHGQGTSVIGQLLGVDCTVTSGDQPTPPGAAVSPLTLQSVDPLRPSGDVLRQLVLRYSNLMIGRICGVSEAAVRKWLRSAGITRSVHKVARNMTEVEIALLRAELRHAITLDQRRLERRPQSKQHRRGRHRELPEVGLRGCWPGIPGGAPKEI